MAHYTVVLTKGSYLVDEADANRIRDAVASRSAFVEVGIDLRCDGVVAHRAEIATAHVVTLVRVPERSPEIGDEKVRPLFSAF
jgi:hypothetical protein